MTICIIICMLALNALLAAYEMALASISRTKIAVLLQEGHAGSQAALFMKDHLEGSLAVVQIGISLVGALAAAYGGASAGSAVAPWLMQHLHLSHHVAGALAMVFVVLPLSFVTIVFAELSPKTFAIKNKDFVVLKMSAAMRVLYWVLSPVVKAMETIVQAITHKQTPAHVDQKTAQKAALADLRTAAAIASSSRLFGKAEEKIVLSSTQFCVRKIREIQVPLEQVYMLDADDSIADTFVKAHLDMHTRFPVRATPDNPQEILGYLNFKDIFLSTKVASVSGGPTTARSIVRPILRLEEDTLISAALEKMMKSKQHISLVTQGTRITGIVTLEDIFEELVGEIEDEYDFFPAYIRPFGAALAASASAKMTDIFERLDLPLPADINSALTVEQWVSRQLNHTPTKNEKIRANGILLETRKFRRHKLMEALISKLD